MGRICSSLVSACIDVFLILVIGFCAAVCRLIVIVIVFLLLSSSGGSSILVLSWYLFVVLWVVFIG